MLGDNSDRVVQLLETIAKNVGGPNTKVNKVSKSTTVNETVNVSEPNDENTGAYFATGVNGVTVPEIGDDFQRIGFGFIARTVNIRFTESINVAFASPYSGGSIIPLKAPSESPFSIGGENGINSGFLWVQKANSADPDPEVDIIAYR